MQAEIDGYQVCFKRAGKGTPLICLHGFPSSSWDFEALWPSLTERFDVIAHDLIGLGKSAKPLQPMTIKLQADIVEGLMAKEGIAEAHILAHDLGDTIAQELLARQLEKSSKVRWKSCVLMNGGIFPETHYALFVQKLLLSAIGKYLVKWMRKKSLEKSLTELFSKAHPPTPEFVETTWNLIRFNNGISMLPRLIHYIKERRKYRERWVKPLVEAIVPIRLINGIEDPVSGKHAADRFAEVVPNADVVFLPNSGHYPHVETPNEVLQAFFEFHYKLLQPAGEKAR